MCHPLDADLPVLIALEIAEDLGYAENSNRDGDEVDTLRQFQPPEGKALRPGVDVLADRPQEKTDGDHPQCLQHGTMGKRDRDQKTKDNQREIFGRAKLDGHRRQRRCGNGQEKRCNAAGKEGAERCRRERLARSALACHLIAIDRRHG